MKIQDFTIHLKGKRKWIIFLCLSSLSCSLLIQISGFVSTGWIFLKGDVYTVHAGLWYRVTCEKGADCTIQPMTNINQQYNDMLEFQIETSIALAACITGVISLGLHVKYKSVILFSLAGMLASLLSGVLALTASGKMGHRYLHQHYEQMGSYGKSVYKIPYSAVLTGIGGLIACFVTFVLITEAHVRSEKTRKHLFLIGNNAIKYNTSLHTVSTGTALPVQYLNTSTSQMVARRLSGSLSSRSTGSLQCAHQMKTHGTGKEIFSCKTVSATACAGTVVNVTNHVGPEIDTKKSDDGNQAGIKDVCSNAVLENGQHVVMNDIYDM